jgi:hypothetical protein
MAQQAIIVYISVEGGEVEDLQDLVDGKEVELDWVGSLNGEDIPIKVRISDDPNDEDWEEDEDDIHIDLSDSTGVVCRCGITLHDIPNAEGFVHCPICDTDTQAT